MVCRSNNLPLLRHLCQLANFIPESTQTQTTRHYSQGQCTLLQRQAANALQQNLPGQRPLIAGGGDASAGSFPVAQMMWVKLEDSTLQ
jgi:hypothetical protein